MENSLNGPATRLTRGAPGRSRPRSGTGTAMRRSSTIRRRTGTSRRSAARWLPLAPLAATAT